MTIKIPTAQIKWLVDRHNVSDTNEEVKADIEKRMSGPQFTPAVRRACLAYAAKCHNRNRVLYRYVMSGMK